MKILVIHNRYLERGGEDEVVDSEIRLLKQFGHSVICYERSNKDIESFSLLHKIRFFIKEIVWSENSYNDIKAIVKKEKPDIAHIHNIFYSISPSVYDALRQEGIPVVQTLHNYRIVCPNALLYIKGKVCERCLRGNFFFAIVNKCWRKSFFLTFFLTRMLRLHAKRKTFINKIDCFIASSEFSKNKYIEAGFPKDRLLIKPNFLPLVWEKRISFEDYALFVGRLEDYKGIHILLSACKEIKSFYFKIIGDGPLLNNLKEKFKNLNYIEFLGRLPNEKVISFVKSSSFVILPSECYENMPRVIIESFACGVPVLASNIGAMRELVKDKLTGILFEPGNSQDLTGKIKLLMQNKDLLIRLGENAYREYLSKYTPERNYDMLLAVYNEAIKNHSFALN